MGLDLRILENKIGYKFKDFHLLKKAMNCFGQIMGVKAIFMA